ncbi:S-layer homology domain-containing protein [Lysinibacillus macroides]|uniref:S-layer homology domain-containing protein n=1 Tax=Lysinibacillus macroides TaxID=33935 RepID=UPI0009F9499A|nr:S-layer homology domain-containing protein [Lysinibacillus macroides]QPR67023.1 S-layer homology domain-containing protein [Lysinibacillus macroides]
MSDGLISWVDVEKSVDSELGDGVPVEKLQDLAIDRVWDNYSGRKIKKNDPQSLINFNYGLRSFRADGNALDGQYSAPWTTFDSSNAREIFSVQTPVGANAGNSDKGIPWEFGGAYVANNTEYTSSNIRTYFSSTGSISYENPELGKLDVLNVISSGDKMKLTVNGINLEENSTNTINYASSATEGAYYLGSSHSKRYDGILGEVLLYNRELTPLERQKVNSYLGLKYGLTIKDENGNATDYVASNGSTNMWTASENTGYGHRITGIGRDNNGALYQKQSKSQAEGAFVTIALGDTVEVSNKDNSNEIDNNLTFFTFSDNDQSGLYSIEIPNTDLPSTIAHTESTTNTTKIMPRVFKVEKNGIWTNEEITLQVEEAKSADYQLYLYVHESNNNFPKATTKAYPLNQTTGTVTLPNSEFVNGGFFTFVKHVDKKALETRVNEINDENLQETDYTVSTWTVFKQALAEAKVVLEDVSKTIDEVATALANLNAARDNLKQPITGAAITTSPGDTVAVVINNVLENVPIIIDTGVTIDSTVLAGYENDLNGANVAIENFKSGDSLIFTNTPNITGNYDSTTGILKLSGAASIAEYQEALRNVQFMTTSTDRSERNIIFTLGNALAYSANGHFYDYIDTQATISWFAAKIQAEGKSYFGRKGYLVTITTEEENTFVKDKTQGLGWLGAKDINRTEASPEKTMRGDWRWVTGPEGLADDGKGLAFYDGYRAGTPADLNPGPVNNAYTNWDGTVEPNNSGNIEYVAHIFGPGAKAGKWNDYSPTNNTVRGYVIEYGGMPGDEAFILSASKKVVFVDKTDLHKEVDEVDALVEEEYTPESWQELEEALEEATLILTNPTATQEQVDVALGKLQEARGKLVKVVPQPTTALLEQTASGNKITVDFNKDITLTDLTGFAIDVDGVKVTPTNFEVVDGKLVLTFPNTPDVTGKTVTVEYDGTGSLEGTNGAKVAAFNKEVENPYSAAFQITQPDTVTTNPRPEISGTVDVTTTPSTVTITLTKEPNGEVVEVDVNVDVDPVTGEWSYTPPVDLPNGTYTVTATATNGQQTVTKQHTFTVATVDKAPLIAKVGEEPQVEAAGPYTPATWQEYQAKLATAKKVINNPTATQEEVNQALAQLTAAQNALVNVGQGLSALTLSTGGSLSPSFQTDTTDYTMNVGYPTASIDFTAIPVENGATVTTTVNGQPGTLNQIPLQVGWNTMVMTVTDANGNVKQYTIKVYREASSGSSGNTGGGGGTTTPAPTPTPEAPKETKTIIHVDLEVDGEHPLEKTTVEIERTTHPDGRVTDFVNLTAEQAQEAVAKAKEIGNTIARIVIPDVQDAVDQATVEVPKEALQVLRDNGLDLEIATDNAHIAIPNSSMNGVDDNFYFRLVPVKKESERQAIEERARAERVVRETLASNDVHVVARPMTIETNLSSRPVVVTLPLRDVTLPTNAAERQAFLASLAVFIEHTDGEKKVVHPEVVTMQDGKPGLRFTVEKFSTFTIIQVAKEAEGTHAAYIQGFPDGTFGPDKNVTRAQVAFMLARILGYTEEQVKQAPFKDVQTNHPAAGAIAFVKEQGIMNGDNEGNFHAGANITRAEMATVVSNFKELAVEENIALTFKDTKGHWAQWIIEANRAAGIINGLDNDRFAPNAALTRAQAVVMINRMFERGPLHGVTTPSFPDVKMTHWAFKEIEEAASSHAYYVDKDGNEQLAE